MAASIPINQTSTNLSSGRTNYARLGVASIDLLPEIMREILLFMQPIHTIVFECKNTYIGNRTLYQKLITAELRNVDRAKTDGYSRFDIPLTYKLLRNLPLQIDPPTNGWDYPNDPADSDATIGDDIERIRRLRNYVAHRQDTNISDHERDSKFSMLKDIAQRLEIFLQKSKGKLVAKVEYLETCCMDETTAHEYEERLKDLARNEVEVGKRVSKLEEDFKLMQLKQKPTDNIQFKESLQDVTGFVGDDVSFSCVLLGGKPTVKWYKNDKRVMSDHIVDESKDEHCKLTFYNVQKEDSGSYIVKFDDEFGKVNLTVEDRPASSIKLRKYQEELIEFALQRKNTIICAGTNAGKTFVAFHIIEDHLLRHPQGKVVFMAKTNVLLEQQYRTACDNLLPPSFKGKICKLDADEDNGLITNFAEEVKRADIIFVTPMFLCNRLHDSAKDKVSISDFSLLILDECHHTYHKDPFNEVMSHYRQIKFNSNKTKLPQIVGLTASPGTNKAKTVNAAVDHLKKVMSNMDVTKLSVVTKNKDELLKWSSVPKQDWIPSRQRQHDPVKDVLIEAMIYVETVLNCELVTRYLLNNAEETGDLHGAIQRKRLQIARTEQSYIQWIMETKKLVKLNLHIDLKVSRLLHACLKHLKLYAECLEVNDLLETDDVIEILKDKYGSFSYESQKANTEEESDLVERLYKVYVDVRQLKDTHEGNPDIAVIKQTLEEEHEKQKEDSRFLIFVKTRVTAKLLAEYLPEYLNSCHLTGSQAAKEQCGLPKQEQLDIVDHFRNGKHLCIVSTTVACEGLDIPKCNLMIRYKIRSNEISSYQMRGRVRTEDGRKLLLLSDKDRMQEEVNIERQYLMQEAIETVVKLDVSKEIEREEKATYKNEEQERMDKKFQQGRQKRGKFSVLCGTCGIVITDGQHMRTIHQKHFIIYDKSFLTSMTTRKPGKNRNFDGIQKRAKLH